MTVPTAPSSDTVSIALDTSTCTSHSKDEDMTEDEVALMVKNALRKARRAMHNSPSDDTEEKEEPVEDEESLSLRSTDYLSISQSMSSVPRAEAAETPVEMSDDDLARRIEEEIKGARAFAEKVYYGGMATDAKEVITGVRTVTTLETDQASNVSTRSAVSMSPRMSPTERPRMMDKAHLGQRPPVSPHSTTSPGSVHLAASEERKVIIPKSLGLDCYDDQDEDEVASSPWTPKDKPDSPVEKPVVRTISHTHPPTPKATTPTSRPTHSNKGQNTHPNTSQATLPPQHLPPTPQAKEPPRQHRQVVFRHPYPLPPPPILPRSDAVIIAENGVRVKHLTFKTAEPDADLTALIRAAEDESLVRRSNACGALKVLASKDLNKAKMCRTRGLLDALITVAREDAADSDALDARTRAVTVLLYLAEPKDNRLLVARHPNVLDVLVKVVKEDTGEARLRACCALATLAKTPQNRGLICATDGLAAILSTMMVENARMEDKKEEGAVEKKKEGDKIAKCTTAESRDDSTMRGEDDRSGSFNSEDERLLTNTFSGTFSHGTGTFTQDDGTVQEDSDDDGSEGEGSILSNEEDDDAFSTEAESMDDGSIQEEGVEMQISSLKKMNIENHSDFLVRSQLSACATLTHLTKHCANAPILVRDEVMLDNIIYVSSIFDNPLHTRCIEILCNLTRFPSNNARLAAKPKVIETLLLCGRSKIPEDRVWAIRIIQNLCSDASSKVTLATGAVLSMLSTSAMRKDYEEQYAAVGALMNLSTEPGSIVPLTNTKTVVATLVHLAHSPNTPSAVRKLACDSLATIGLWLQTLASAGTVPEDIPFSTLPSHSATGWLRWDS